MPEPRAIQDEPSPSTALQRGERHPSVFALLVWVALAAACAASAILAAALLSDRLWAKATPAGMVLIPGGDFTMGARDDDTLARDDERPAHRVRVQPFYMDATEVTNAQFAAFVKATGHVTTAERPVDWEELKKQVPPGTPKPPDEMLRPGSLVFTPPKGPVALNNPASWWTWTAGANWRHPGGPSTTIEGKDAVPVVQVSWDDAVAYCTWAGRRLPTEAEWEFAARGGLEKKINVWGDEPVDGTRANTWQGHFPWMNMANDDGGDASVLAAPVKRFPPNGYGLFDMAGNVWEWCADLYDAGAYTKLANKPPSAAADPAAAPACHDPRNPHSSTSRVQRGGSFLCHDSYCASYRPSARMASPADTSIQHLGFRTVISVDAWKRRQTEPKKSPPSSCP